MKKGPKKERTLKPSAVLLSIVIHLGLFLLAGMLVVFTVVKKKEIVFDPPKSVERPKMKLKKPKVKVRKSSRPKSTPRITTKSTQSSMPVIELPEMGGIGDGLGGDGVDGFDLMPDLGEVTLMGAAESIGNDFEGTFYDFKRDYAGRNIPMTSSACVDLFLKFLKRNWDTSVLNRYYRSPKKIYSTTFMIPVARANLAPEIFNEETEGWAWGVHSRGELVYPEDIKFRFWGAGLQFMAVRVDGEIVLISNFENYRNQGLTPLRSSLWQSSSADNQKYPLGLFKAEVGDWIELKAGEPVEMEVLYGIFGGGLFNAMLLVEVEGEEYPKNDFKGGPKLPVFKTENLTLDQVEMIGSRLYPGYATLTNGPVFRDYFVDSDSAASVEAPVSSPSVPTNDSPAAFEERKRRWTTADGQVFKAEYERIFGDKVLMKDDKGERARIPVAELSAEDRDYLQLMNPPSFSIELSKKSRQRIEMPNITEIDKGRPIRRLNYVFGAKVKQQGSRSYNHPLTIEYFTFGEEVDGDNYVLVDRKKETFIPDKHNEGEFEFYGDTVELMTWAIDKSRPLHGTKYGGFLITITDKRGNMVQHKVTHEFLLENLENLKQVPTGKHFDEACNRVAPPRPGKDDLPTWM